jgi:hypothetical protein
VTISCFYWLLDTSSDWLCCVAAQTPRTRSRYSFCVTSSRCFAGKSPDQAAIHPIECFWPRWPGSFLVTLAPSNRNQQSKGPAEVRDRRRTRPCSAPRRAQRAHSRVRDRGVTNDEPPSDPRALSGLRDRHVSCDFLMPRIGDGRIRSSQATERTKDGRYAPVMLLLAPKT